MRQFEERYLTAIDLCTEMIDILIAISALLLANCNRTVKQVTPTLSTPLPGRQERSDIGKPVPGRRIL